MIYNDGPSIQNFCVNATTSTLDHKLNILIENEYPVGTTFFMTLVVVKNFGLSPILGIPKLEIKTILLIAVV